MANLRPSPLIRDPVTWRTAAVCTNEDRSSFSTASEDGKPNTESLTSHHRIIAKIDLRSCGEASLPDADEENDRLLDLLTEEPP